MKSLSDIKEKEVKGKKKSLPKLINILGDPYKKHWPVLKEDELKQFSHLLQTAMASSGQTTREFVKSTGIRIGLESSLRAIKNCETSCVLISLSLKPHFLIGLVARNVEVKDATVPVYVQPKLEDLTQQLVGIRSLILTLPKNVSAISVDLANWVSMRTRQPRSAKTVQVMRPERKRKAKSPPLPTPVEIKKPALSTTTTTQAVEAEKIEFKEDFISFTQEQATADNYRLQNLHEDKSKLVAALGKLATHAEVKQQAAQAKTQMCAMEVDDNETPVASAETTKSEADSDSNDFITGKYKQLTVLQLNPNPNKQNKKKRKNKNKKNKNKNTNKAK